MAGCLVFGFQPRAAIAASREAAQAFFDHVGASLDIAFIAIAAADAHTIAAAMELGAMDLGVFDAREWILVPKDFVNLELFAQEVRYGDSSDHGQWFTNDASICGSEPVEGAFYYDAEGNVEPREPTDTPALQVGWNPDGSRDESFDPGLACPDPVDLSVVVGKTIAFVSEESPTGFLVPTVELQERGITKNQYDSIFINSHDAAVAAVYDRTADIGVAFDDARGFVQDNHPDVGSMVIVFNITSRIAYPVMAVRANLPATLKEALIAEILGYTKTLPGQTDLAAAIGWMTLTPADTATTQSLETVARLEQARGENG